MPDLLPGGGHAESGTVVLVLVPLMLVLRDALGETGELDAVYAVSGRLASMAVARVG
jgi:hypothetical protein